MLNAVYALAVLARCCLLGSRHRHRLVGVAVAVRSIPVAKALVARWVGIVSAAWRVSVSSVGSRADGSSANAYRHSTAYGCATVNTAAIDACVMNASAANANAPSAICERIS